MQYKHYLMDISVCTSSCQFSSAESAHAKFLKVMKEWHSKEKSFELALATCNGWFSNLNIHICSRMLKWQKLSADLDGKNVVSALLPVTSPHGMSSCYNMFSHALRRTWTYSMSCDYHVINCTVPTRGCLLWYFNW